MEVLQGISDTNTSQKIIDAQTHNKGSVGEDNLFVRFCRKKFLCVMSFLFCFVLILEVFKIFLSKADQEQVGQLSSFLLQTLLGVLLTNNITTATDL